MCGIYGILDLKAASPPEESLLTKMGDIIHHRGPDDHGHFLSPEMAFGMRRLSIIDVEGGHQPIANEDKSIG